MPTPRRQGNNAAAKALVMALDVTETLARALRVKAALNDLSPQDQLRSIVGLPFSRPQRPRLNLSLSTEDCEILGNRYGLETSARPAIKRAVMQELLDSLSS